ncbi:VOC family protein [Paracoccus sp. (in: a-proteobacteria)]|uniref:VOC family protein n=1 Tax=Paracoccus sp. TaxID=267 RepID=UPI0026E03BD2|nr:VOC family protein [Paracoccus sp. (in: a-proteobacteria)]MDO5648087.1 VOC family protein [Paracoccus sp. (in: a-proteobacteria)]
MTHHGTPFWYELTTTDLPGAGAFYSDILGWDVTDSSSADMTYHLARTPAGMVAGIAPQQDTDIPPNWLIYFAVDDCDAAVQAITDAGGQILMPAMDMPGTGRFAVATDPQGAAFGLMQPEPMEDGTGNAAFDQSRAGHGNWNELMTTDPAAALSFYGALMGWTPGQAMPMGSMGTYQLFHHAGADIGAIMGLGDAPMPVWLPYFGVSDPVSTVAERITAAGGAIHHGPAEVPGPAYITVATDPQGAWFAIVGTTK